MPLNRLISIINQMYHANIVYEGSDETSPFSGTIRQEEVLMILFSKSVCNE